MRKKITFEIDTETESSRIESYLKKWLIENFRLPKSVKIKIEEIRDEKY